MSIAIDSSPFLRAPAEFIDRDVAPARANLIDPLELGNNLAEIIASQDDRALNGGIRAGRPVLTPPSRDYALLERLSAIIKDTASTRASAANAKVKVLEIMATRHGQAIDQNEKEVQEARERADKTAKIFSWVSWTLGALLLAATAVATVLTVGVAGVLIGAAVMAVDYTVKATTGKSVTERVMEQIPMDKVASFIGDQLKKMGASDEVAEIVGVVLAYVALLIAVVMVAKAASKLVLNRASAAAGRMVSKAFSKVPSSVTRHVSKAAGVAGRIKGKIPDGVKASVGPVAQYTAQAAQVAAPLSQGAGSSIASYQNLQAANGTAEITLLGANRNNIDQLLDRTLSSADDDSRLSESLTEIIANFYNSRAQTALKMSRRFG